MTEENVNNIEETTSQETVEDNDNDLDTSADSPQAESTDKEDVEALKARLAELEEKNKQLYARTKKTESKVKTVQKTDSNIEGDIELIEFFAKGNSRDDYQKLQVIMQGTGQSMQEAMNDPLYTAYKEKREKEMRDEKAQIGASKSGGADDRIFKPNMTPAEHREAWKKTRNR